jgi:VWFA-related protein
MSLRTATLLASACAVLGADDPAEPRLLDLNVVALDNRGQAVTDLTVGDLQITDGGKPQKIVFFRHRDSSVWQKPQLAPNELSNRGGAGIPHATVILFDLMNESFGSRGTAANQIVHYLEGLENADYLYLYMLTVEGRLFAVHGLPEGEENPEPGGAPWTKKIKPMMDQSLKTVTRARPIEVDVAIRVQLTFAGLDALAVQLSRVPGRKNLVWVTDGVPIELGQRRSDTGEPVDFTPMLRRFSQALERSGVAMFPVRQVMLGSPDHIGDSSGGSGATGGNDLGTQSIATLDEFANVTGGRPGGGKDIGAAVTQAMNDSRTSYQIGYYAPENNWDNKFHKVRVTCKRKGVRIQAKTGYYAWSDAPGVESEQAIKAAAGVPFDAAEIGLTGSLSGSQLKARIDAKDIALAEAGDHYEGQLRIAVVGYAADGRAEESSVVHAPLRYDAQERDKALHEGIAFTQNVAKADQFSKVRLIVFDRGSNAIGSLTIPVGRVAPK